LNRLHPFYLVYVAKDGQIVSNHTEVKRLLDLARTACKGKEEPVHSVCKIFNEATNDGREMAFYSDLLDKAIQSMVAIKEERDIDSLFSGGRTSALIDKINGLDDFELISFLVIQGK
jgi:hypothetical protein